MRLANCRENKSTWYKYARILGITHWKQISKLWYIHDSIIQPSKWIKISKWNLAGQSTDYASSNVSFLWQGTIKEN